LWLHLCHKPGTILRRGRSRRRLSLVSDEREDIALLHDHRKDMPDLAGTSEKYGVVGTQRERSELSSLDGTLEGREGWSTSCKGEREQPRRGGLLSWSRRIQGICGASFVNKAVVDPHSSIGGRKGATEWEIYKTIVSPQGQTSKRRVLALFSNVEVRAGRLSQGELDIDSES
jgi:hypothetical protein